MGKSKRSDKSFTREQRLSRENRQLKQELKHLRKQIARLDGERLESLRVAEAEDTEKFQKDLESPSSNIEALKKEWACRVCQTGVLEIILYSKLGGETWYYRRCSDCYKRTKGQRYAETVKGIVKND